MSATSLFRYYFYTIYFYRTASVLAYLKNCQMFSILVYSYLDCSFSIKYRKFIINSTRSPNFKLLLLQMYVKRNVLADNISAYLVNVHQWPPLRRHNR